MSKIVTRESLDENWMFQFFIATKYRLYRHLLMILFICLAMFNSDPEYIQPIETISQVVALALFLLLVYTNMYWLVPKFLLKNRYAKYSLSVLGVLVLSGIVYSIGRYLYPPEVRLDPTKEDVGIFPFSFVIIILVSASSAIKLFQQWMLDVQVISELEQANINAELEQLKNQINPHFLFNTLNNANVLTKKDPEKASEVLMKLSDLLRYQLYDSTREKVLLTSDIHFLEDFLNLEKIRRDSFDFLISKEGNISGVQIPPLLFISFVENAVKHNNDSSKPSYVHLFFTVQSEQITFVCVNSKPLLKAVNSGTGGLGLTNIKRRLELLFPASHTLKIEDNIDTYSVTLILNV